MAITRTTRAPRRAFRGVREHRQLLDAGRAPRGPGCRTGALSPGPRASVSFCRQATRTCRPRRLAEAGTSGQQCARDQNGSSSPADDPNGPSCCSLCNPSPKWKAAPRRAATADFQRPRATGYGSAGRASGRESHRRCRVVARALEASRSPRSLVQLDGGRAHRARYAPSKCASDGSIAAFAATSPYS